MLNLITWKTMKIQIGGLTTKHLVVDFLQQAVHYFEGLKKKSYFMLFKQMNKQTLRSKLLIHLLTDKKANLMLFHFNVVRLFW